MNDAENSAFITK